MSAFDARNEAKLLERGKEYHEAGDLRGAATVFSEILRGNPRHPVALFRMGCLLHEAGNFQQAAELLHAAVKASPKEPECHNALAMALFGLGRESEAEQALRRAIAISSRPHFHLSLAGVLRRAGRSNEALEEYRSALASGADPEETRLCIGRLHLSRGEGRQARAYFREILENNPLHAGALKSLRESLRAEGRDKDAADCLDLALGAAPDGDDAGLRDFADALQGSGDFAGACVVYRRLLLSAAASAENWYALGCAETSRNEFANAVECFERVLELQPDWSKARHNLGRAFFEIGRVDEAATCLRACAATNDESSALARKMLAAIIPGVADADNQAVLDTRRDWVRRDLSAKSAARAVREVSRNGGPLRIGYVSSFFHRDNWMKPVWGLINRHDRSEIEVHLFADCEREAIVHGYRQDSRDHFHDTRKLDHDGLQRRIVESGVQVLIDLNGFSDLNRLPMFERKLAPVTIGWFNMYATTGLPGFDYLIGDEDVIPASEERFYSERILRVRGASYLTFAVDYPVPPVSPAPRSNAPGAGVMFGSLCSLYKITPRVIAAWSRIVVSVAGSRLLLKNASLKSNGARGYLREQFAKCGVSGDRLQLEGPSDHFAFLQAYDRIDLALDTFPYNGGTSTTEAIWQGVPVLTYDGDRWASRTSASILRAAGLGEYVAADCESFEAMAVRMGNLPAVELAGIRAGMRDRIRMTTACDTAGFARQMEALYRDCYSRSLA